MRAERHDGSDAVHRPAAVYVAVLVSAAALADAGLWLGRGSVMTDWPTLAALAVAAAVAQAFPVTAPRRTLYHTSIAFLVAATLLLPPALLVLIPVAMSAGEWLRERRSWPLHGFNAATYTLAALAAWGAAHPLRGARMLPGDDARFALAGLAACVAFVATNHLLLGVVVRLRRETGVPLLSFESIAIDLVLTMLGVSLAAFIEWNPWLVFAALGPLVVVHRSLSVSQLQAEARIDSKTGLYNARYFTSALAAELARAERFERPMAVIMADLDLLRDLNNSWGHLAGDAVLRGIADVFRAELRHYDVPARFGGEEFSILLPETTAEQAFEIAERIRRAVAERRFEVETAPEALRATLSLGVAAFPRDGTDANELVHQADLAVYRAKLQGRNRTLAAGGEAPLAETPTRPPVALARSPLPAAAEEPVPTAVPTPVHELLRLHLRAPSRSLRLLVATVALAGPLAGIAALAERGGGDVLGLVALAGLVAAGQALSTDISDATGPISVAAVAALTGAALFGVRAALPLAIAAAAVDWSNRRTSLREIAYGGGTLALAALAAAAVFSIGGPTSTTLARALLGVVAGAVYFAVVMGLLSCASGFETEESAWSVFRERCAWLLPHYLVYGFVAAVIAVAYDAAGIWALAVFAGPLFLIRRTQAQYLEHTRRAADRLHEASETIQAQNESLERANRLLRERTTAAMESLSATVDARDAYTAGHSRRVQQIALALGRELGLSQAELDLLDRAALFHDIGKIAVPDAILLKAGPLTSLEWDVMRRHAEEGARIIERLGFLQDAVPAIRHHHERWDGSGYPDGLAAGDIPLGARIIHVADALDSMLTTRIYRAAQPLEDVLAEIRAASGSQFCPRCVVALERLLPVEEPLEELPRLVAVS
ncbi:MAG TPA: diguanylate cyclase [Gaiellaceae bacterium]|nr:diguanylate cyclase [Gaiellaceae bacterium]